ncbi:MAG: hypothetical protein HC799_05605 [Limnothrix sp. RL_2_0]|nr:hypothetical protein [Limnothrix sp. RL_2_0]
MSEVLNIPEAIWRSPFLFSVTSEIPPKNTRVEHILNLIGEALSRSENKRCNNYFHVSF